MQLIFASRRTASRRAVVRRRTAIIVGTACALWLVLSLLGPFVAQPAGYHGFADQRAWGAIPHALDVLSNLGFLVAALAGGGLLARLPSHETTRAARSMAAIFFIGLACSFAGSSFYHWHPDDASLAWDRLAMCVPFAGMLGLAAQQACGDDAAWPACIAMLASAVAAVLLWQHSGNMLSWALAQGGGMLVLLWLAARRRREGGLQIRLGWVIALYAVAKCFELADAQVFAWSDGFISGHSLKHLFAAAAVLPVLHALAALRERSATWL